jgi:hypothetical protein
LKKNLTTLQVFKFKVPKEKNKFLESFYLKKDNFLNKEKFFFSKFFYKIQNINKSFKKYMKELIKNKNLEKKRFIFYLYNYIYLKYIYIRKLKNIIKNSIYKKKLN